MKSKEMLWDEDDGGQNMHKLATNCMRNIH